MEDIIGGWIVFLTRFKVGRMVLWAEYIVDYILAFLLGIMYQYFSTTPMKIHLSEGYRRRVKGRYPLTHIF